MDSGIMRISSRHSVAQTMQRLESLLTERGVMIFGNPKAGTPLMQTVPAAGLDVPLKALVWEDSEGHTQIAYNDPHYIIQRHGLDAALAANLAAVVPLIERAARD
jgi:uncharacterized protein (DUF302 family)